MNGAHDLGGMHGLGPVAPEPGEPAFHDAWERRAFALTLAAGFHGRWNIDRSRHVRENRHPVDYLSSSYYEIWFKALETLVAETGLAKDAPKGHDPATASAMLKRGFTCRVPAEDAAEPRFRVGDAVLVRERTTPGHTRAPRYCRGKRGIVTLDHGAFVFPDTHAHGLGTKPQHVYSVRFDGTTLWGEGGDPKLVVQVDLWDDYLEPAP